jgi:cyanophycin synthetase
MKIVEVKATSGPNYWSIRRHKLIVMLLDLEEMEDYPTNLIPGFYERLSTLIPSLWEHRCSEGKPGGFFERVKEGTWLGHVIEHIALEIQSLAGMNTGFGRTRSAGKSGLYHVVFSYEYTEAGIYAANAAVAIAQALVNGQEYLLKDTVDALRRLREEHCLGPSTAALVAEAEKRGIPWIRLNDGSYIQLGYGAAQRRIEATIASTTCSISVENACNKQITKRLLEEAHVPVPQGCTIEQEEQIFDVIKQVGFPFVIKPVNGNQGKGATTNIRTLEEAVVAFWQAKKYDKTLVCEKFITGADFRALVVNYKLIAAAKRSPAAVTGDGIHTIRELIDICNNDPRRGYGHENILTQIILDDDSLHTLAKNGFSPTTVPPKGKEVVLKSTANLSTGGTAMDVTDQLDPENVLLFERIARVMGLDICGIDIMAPSLTTPITSNGGAIIEVNAAPGLRMHLQPAIGQPRNVAAPILDMLFPGNASGRIPIVAITGTNGKTTTTRLMAHIAATAGYKVGFTTTDGIYINQQLIYSGDCTGPVSAQVILKDPGVDMAVLECARGGILRAGLAFDKCDVAIITNVAEDHLGMKGIDTIEKLAKVKSIVAQTVHSQGYAVLNADDDLVYAMRQELDCKVALFTMISDNPRIHEHIRTGGIAAVYEDGNIMVLRQNAAYRIGHVTDIPITFDGKAGFNVANAMAASLAAFLRDIPPSKIFAALHTFVPSPETSPGRMNLFEYNACKIFVDYAHNAHGITAVGECIRNMPARIKLGVIAGVGDRRPEDIIAVGATAARYFDELIIRQDNDTRGRTPEEIETLVCLGIRQVDPRKKVSIIREESQAVTAVLNYVAEDMIAVIFADDVPAVLLQMKEAEISRKFTNQNQVEVA